MTRTSEQHRSPEGPSRRREFAVEAMVAVAAAEGRTRRASDTRFFDQITTVLHGAGEVGEAAPVVAVLGSELGLGGMWQVIGELERRYGPSGTEITRAVLSWTVQHHTPAEEPPLDPDEVTYATQQELRRWVTTRDTADVVSWGVRVVDDPGELVEILCRAPRTSHDEILSRYLEIAGPDAVLALVASHGTRISPGAVARTAGRL